MGSGPSPEERAHSQSAVALILRKTHSLAGCRGTFLRTSRPVRIPCNCDWNEITNWHNGTSCNLIRCTPPSPLSSCLLFSRYADTHRRVLAGIAPASGGGSVFRAKPVPTIVSKHLVALRGIPSAVRYNPGEEQAPLYRGEGISGIVAVQLVTCSVISCTTVGAGQDNERCLAQIACTI